MSKELLEALRSDAIPIGPRTFDMCRDAADEIERLQAECGNELKQRLDALSDDQRLELFGRYCADCGCKQPESGKRCQCRNDE